MNIGTCKLCLKECTIQDSHLIPAAAFARIRAAEKNPSRHPIVITRSTSVRTSDQPRAYLLCADCEDRFNRWGERPVLSLSANSLFGDTARFPLLERLQLSMGKRTAIGFRYSATRTGIDTDVLAYFALSLAWRAAVAEWRGKLGSSIAKVDLGTTEEPIRLFLLHNKPFPDHVAIIVHVCSDRISHGILLPPSLTVGLYGPSTEVHVLGINYFVFTGLDIDPTIRQMCCINGPGKPLFQTDCKHRIHAYYREVSKLSRKTATFREEWPD